MVGLWNGFLSIRGGFDGGMKWRDEILPRILGTSSDPCLISSCHYQLE